MCNTIESLSLYKPYLVINELPGMLLHCVWLRVFLFYVGYWSVDKMDEGAGVHLRWGSKGQRVSSAVWSELHMATPSWDESPLSLTIQLGLKKTVGIVRGFSWKCDKGNLDWIMIEISAPSRRQMSGITSADLSGVERLHLLHHDTNGQISEPYGPH